ncbi:bifunctional response regulator/alkaline phosphatase family protein [Lutibacter sp. B1]|uniref:T9SS response regulator signal transducer PorX n=1 Tax=Lutibacter sp. B1 TaxID=2725996 RepID=UPI0014575C55|nr:bifunctional response regulator/alkaline phosphatase family protein [Lutibacter sp. B1]NLP58119.1 bifunctional response regulator/alkaline phosphatase family protein [Lutibacter sp. B1]
MSKINILWVDDEIDILKPHILFLEKKGYTVETCNNGADAIEMCEQNTYDIVFLDENMPGLSGLETLTEIKGKKPNVPVVMITKSEEEYIMEEAIGNKIADYLIKPVNPHQILLSLKKNLDISRLVSEKTTSNYQQEFRKIAMDLAMVNSYKEWVDIYKKLVYWELELENISDTGMIEILESQKQEANSLFFKFIKKNYKDWLFDDDVPVLSNTLFKKIILPEVQNSNGTLVVVIDNLRYDQFKILELTINRYYKKQEEVSYFSILPTATQYARNAIFSGLMPLEMAQKYPNYWKDDIDDGGKNLYEEEFLTEQLKRLKQHIKTDFYKITNLKNGKQLADNFNSVKENDLTVIVYNFVDMLSHAKTEMEVIKELASDDKAYRSLTNSWFKNSPLLEIIQKAQGLGLKLIITTDHGTINSKTPAKVIGDKNISSNLRYKTGKSLTYDEKEVYAVKNPKEILLPSINVSSSYIFAKEDFFFAYPNNYNHFVKYYKNTYQHGGISLEEMIIPCAIFVPK